MASPYLVTGCAGFIGARVCQRLLDAGHEVVGWDNTNDAYDPKLKDWRLATLRRHKDFQFSAVDIADRQHVESHFANKPFAAVINLAARAGVRASVENPWVYIDTNVTGTLNLLEACRAS